MTDDRDGGVLEREIDEAARELIEAMAARRVRKRPMLVRTGGKEKMERYPGNNR